MKRHVRVFVGIILLLVALGAGLVHVGLNKRACGNSLRLTSHGKPRTLTCLDGPCEPLRYFGQRVLAVLTVLAAPKTDALQVVTVGQDPFGIAVDTRMGHVFVVNTKQRNGPSTVSVLGAADGVPRRTTPVGVWAHGIVVDDRCGRAFVANTADAPTHAPDSVSVIDTRTEQEQRRVTLGASAMTMAVDRTVGRVFLGLDNGRVRILDAENGRPVGTTVRRPFSGSRLSPQLWTSAAGARFSSGPVARGWVTSPCSTRMVAAYCGKR